MISHNRSADPNDVVSTMSRTGYCGVEWFPCDVGVQAFDGLPATGIAPLDLG